MTDVLDRKGTRTLDGRYSLVRFVGKGGMGEVWRAVDRRLKRDVAIKFPRRPLGESGAEHWLSAEAQTVARLSHPHVVSLLDRTVLPAGTEKEPVEGELPALVFQYVSGKPLSMWCDQPRPWMWIHKLARQILEALAYAHGRGVVHRDLKPSNVLLSGDPRDPWVSLLDFGIAAWAAPGGSGPDILRADGIEHVAGTRAYMAPEQAKGPKGDVGPWTDLYSLGVVLTELLIGTCPFPGETQELLWTLRNHSHFAPPIQALSDLGVPLRRFLLRLMAPDPAQRFGWAADALRSLPPPTTDDLTTGSRDFNPEVTDVLLTAVRPAEDRDTDHDLDADTDPNVDPPTAELDDDPAGRSFGVEADAIKSAGGSVTLELAPAGEAAVALPPSWQMDRPDPGAWKAGLEALPLDRAAPPVPAASYALLAMREAPLKGRDAEWEQAWSHLSSVAEDGRPALLLVEGAQGRGKTRFARELAAVAEQLGVARSHHVRFRADGSGTGALRRLLLRVLRVATLPESEREDRVRRVLSEAGYPADADLVPRLLSLLSPSQHTRRPEQEEAATAVELFRVLGRRRPLLLWLEDIGRARDKALSTLLQYLFEAEGHLPVAVVATARNDIPTTGAAWPPEWMMLRTHPRTRILQMPALSDDALAGVLTFTAGLSKDVGLEIARWGRGDPRAAQQIARHLHETGRLRWTPEGYELSGNTPSTAGHLKLGSILEARARDATESSADRDATRAVLELLSLVSERARYDDLVAAAERIGVPAKRVEGALAPLVMAALVEVRDEGPRLVHLALAERLAARIELKTKMACHRAWASVLEAPPYGPGSAERLLEAARNRNAAGQHAQAARDELGAAKLLRERWEVKAAWRASRRALERVDAHPELLRGEEEAELCVLAAVLEHEAQEEAATASALTAALDMLQPLWIALPPTEERCRCDFTHAQALRAAGRTREAVEALERTLEGARAIKSTLWECHALSALAAILRLEGDFARAEELAEEAAGIASSIGDSQLMLEVLATRLPLAVARHDTDRGRLLLDKLRSLLRLRASWQDLQNLWRFRGDVERSAGNESAARQAYRTALVLGERRGLPNARVHLALTAMGLSAGDILTAKQSLAAVADVDSFRGDSAHELRSNAAIYRVELAVRTGRAAEAAAALQDAEILQQQSPLADPGLQWSLERAMAATPDKTLRKRLRNLSDAMEKAMDRGSDPGRRRGRR
ncbi:MAG: protein kinase [Deltaproteobacteria bacterium]|nr:protein kinase [Deltaproteobacteria bacterium]